MKKFVSLALALMLCLLSVGAMAEGGVPVEELKVGFIFIGDENEGYTANHYNGAKEMAAALGLSEDQLLIKWVVPENEECEDAAYDLADQGCQIICCSALLTTTMCEMENVVKKANEAGIHDKVKIMIGGAPVTQSFCDQIGADCYTPDAASAADAAVAFCKATA